MIIVFLGAPGAGKGTQAKIIAKKYHIPHISTGDMFRANIGAKTELGMKAKEYIDQGVLVPDELVIEMLLDRIKHGDCYKGYVLDGFPRTIPQAKALDSALHNRGDRIEYAIDVDVPDEYIVKRMSGRRACSLCGAIYNLDFNPTKEEGYCDKCHGRLILRDDDKPLTVQKRLVVYHNQTKPLIQHYKLQNVLHRVDGTKDIDNVTEQISKILGERR